VTDVLPPEVAKWQFVEEKVRAVLEAYAYREVRARMDRAYVAGRRWEREVATKWYRFEGETVTAAFFGVGEASADEEVVEMAAAIATEAGARSFEAPRLRYELSLPDLRKIPVREVKVDLAALVAAVPDPPESFEPQLGAFIVSEAAERAWAMQAARQLRLAGIRTELAHDGAPVADQVSRARAIGARLAVVAAGGKVTVEDFGTGRSFEVAPDDVESAVRPLLD
jgi:hypothetical protein